MSCKGHTFSAFWLRSSVVSVLDEVTFVSHPLGRHKLLYSLGLNGLCLHPIRCGPSHALPAGNVAPNLLNEKKDSMAQRQRVGFQIQRLGVRIPLGSLFDI